MLTRRLQQIGTESAGKESEDAAKCPKIGLIDRNRNFKKVRHGSASLHEHTAPKAARARISASRKERGRSTGEEGAVVRFVDGHKKKERSCER